MSRRPRNFREHAPLRANYSDFEYLLHFDGSCDPNPGGTPSYGFVIYDVELKEVETGQGVAEGKYRPTNNTAEFSGLLAGLARCVTIANGATIRVRGDSQLVIYGMHKGWPMRKSPHLADLAQRCRRIVSDYPGVIEFEWVRRQFNARADGLAESTPKKPARNRKVRKEQIIAGLPQAAGAEIARIERLRIIEWLRSEAEALKGKAGHHLDLAYQDIAIRIESLEHQKAAAA